MMPSQPTKPSVKPQMRFSNKLGDYFHPAPTERCPRCGSHPNRSRAIRRYNRATNQVQSQYGYCACGQVLYY